MPPSVPPERPDVRRRPSSVVTISSCASEPGVSASSKPSPTSTPLIAWMPISAPASRASRRRSQCTCEPRPGGRPWTTTSTTPPRVSPSLWAWSMRGDHRGAGLGVEAADLVGVEPLDVVGSGHEAGGRLDAAERDDVGDDPGADGLLEEVGRHPAERDAGRGLAGGRALEDRAGLVEVVLLHADEVGVAGPRTGQRGVAGQRLELDGVDRVGRHDLLPLRPLGVADLDGDRAALGLAVADAAEHADLVLLELHPGAAAVAEPAPGQRVGEVVGRDADVGGQPLEDRHQRGTVGLACCEPSEHG